MSAHLLLRLPVAKRRQRQWLAGIVIRDASQAHSSSRAGQMGDRGRCELPGHPDWTLVKGVGQGVGSVVRRIGLVAGILVLWGSALGCAMQDPSLQARVDAQATEIAQLRAALPSLSATTPASSIMAGLGPSPTPADRSITSVATPTRERTPNSTWNTLTSAPPVPVVDQLIATLHLIPGPAELNRTVFLAINLRSTPNAKYLPTAWRTLSAAYEGRLIGDYYAVALDSAYTGKPVPEPGQFYEDWLLLMKGCVDSQAHLPLKDRHPCVYFPAQPEKYYAGVLKRIATEWDRSSLVYEYAIAPANADMVWCLARFGWMDTPYRLKTPVFQEQWYLFTDRLDKGEDITWPEYLLTNTPAPALR